MSSEQKIPEEAKKAVLSSSFTERLIQKARRRHTFREFLFMMIVGFRTIIGGFFKIETIATRHDKQKKEDDHEILE